VRQVTDFLHSYGRNRKAAGQLETDGFALSPACHATRAVETGKRSGLSSAQPPSPPSGDGGISVRRTISNRFWAARCDGRHKKASPLPAALVRSNKYAGKVYALPGNPRPPARSQKSAALPTNKIDYAETLLRPLPQLLPSKILKMSTMSSSIPQPPDVGCLTPTRFAVVVPQPFDTLKAPPATTSNSASVSTRRSLI
jgi:hypothetical protein